MNAPAHAQAVMSNLETRFQTRYLDITDIRTLLKRKGVQNVLSELVSYIESDYRRWQDFHKCARVANHSDNGVIELMPVSDSQLYGFKYVNGHPANTFQNMLTVMAFGALADVATGFPLLLSEFTIVTALRTAATSAWVARLLARPNAKRMAVIGNGAQSEFQILAFTTVLGINEVRVFDIDPHATDKLVRNLAGLPGLTLLRCHSAAEAVRGADIVTTVTADKNYATILTPDMIEDGMHINAVGGDCPGKTELHAEVLLRGKVFVEYEPQSRIEGDIQQMPADFPVTELWEVLQQVKPGRENAQQITIFDSVGFALEDFSALRYLHEHSREMSLGSLMNLIPQDFNPKDLFGFSSRID